MKNYLRSYAKVNLIWSPLVTAFFCLFYDHGEFWRSWAISMVIAVVIGSGCIWGSFAVAQLDIWVFRRLGAPHSGRGKLWSFFVSVVLMPLFMFPAFDVAAAFAPLIGTTFRRPDWGTTKTSMLYGVLICGVFLLIESLREARLARERAERLAAEAENARLRAQLAALGAQVNPHLLFNSLNTVASLIASDASAAEAMTLDLSEWYRDILTTSRRDSHSLRDELDLCERYLRIERARFGERLAFEVATDPALSSVPIPPLTLQPLVENAVKYAVAPRAKGGSIRLLARAAEDAAEITIEDDGPGMGSSAAGGCGTGIENARERLALFFGGRSELVLQGGEAGGTLVRVRLPLPEATA